MDCLDFLRDAPRGGITVHVETAKGSTIIGGINIDLIQEHAPLLLKRLTTRDGNSALVFKDQESRVAVISLLRFIYLQDYRLSERLLDAPCSLLFHLQLYRVAQIYSIPALQTQARRYFTCELEYACSEGKMSIDLCNAIRFLYLELDDEEDLQKTVAHYCVSNFMYHGLSLSETFRQTVFEAPIFQSLLLKINMDQGFTAEGAGEIIAMQTCGFPAHRSWNRDIRRSANFLCHMHTSDFERTALEAKPWDEPSLLHRFVVVQRVCVERREREANARTVQTLNGVADRLHDMCDNEEAPNTSMNPRALRYRLAHTFSNDDFDAFESAMGFEPGHSLSYNNHMDVCTRGQVHDTNEQPFSEVQPESSEHSDSDWSLVDTIPDENDDQPLLSAAMDPGRHGPLTVRNQLSPDESSDEDWEVFSMERPAVT